MVSICNAFSPSIVQGFFSTRNLHILIWSHIVVLVISTQFRRGCSFHGSRCLLAISPRYHGMFSCPSYVNSKLFISPPIACGCRRQSCVARFHFFTGCRPVLPGCQQEYVQKCIIRVGDSHRRCNPCQLSLLHLPLNWTALDLPMLCRMAANRGNHHPDYRMVGSRWCVLRARPSLGYSFII